MYIAHSSPNFIGKLVDDGVKLSVQKGKLIQRTIYQQGSGEVHQVQVPIKVGATETPWALLITVPMHAINRPGKDAVQAILVISMVTGLSMLGLIWLFIAKGMSPLTIVTNQIKAIAANTKGAIPNITNVKAGEISTLTHAFNKMIDALNQSRQSLVTVNNELEDRVNVRTKELEESLELQKQIQRQLIETEKMASLGTLVAGIAHEINTPIGVALTGSSHLQELTKNLLEKHNDQTLCKSEFNNYIDSTIQTCDIIEKNIYRASSLISNFKMVAVDRSHEEYRKVNLSKYIASILESLQPSFKKNRVELATYIDEGIYATCDPGTLAHIISNTVMNSFLHAFSGSTQPSKKIKISCSQQNKGIELTIEDNGVGMTPEVKEKLFDPFYTTRRGEGGSGLGMHIVYNMVCHKLNGTINVDSVIGKGTLIKVVFAVNN